MTTLNIGIYYHCFAFEATKCRLGKNSGYITSLSPPTLPLYVSSCLWRTQHLKPTEESYNKAQTYKLFFVGNTWDKAVCFSDVVAVVKTSFLKRTLCLIWTDSYEGSDSRKKSYSLCNTSELSDEINSTDRFFLRLQTGIGVDNIPTKF